MFSVLFEVFPAEGKKDDYLDKAKFLKPVLETIDGFIDNERFESRCKPGWVLSHSTWRDEKSLVRWRTQGDHHAMQEKGRFEVFQDYRLRIAEATFDTDPPKEAPIREQRLDETEVGPGKFVTLTEITPAKGAGFTAQTDLLAARFGLEASSHPDEKALGGPPWTPRSACIRKSDSSAKSWFARPVAPISA